MSMKRILSILSVATVMAAMIAASAVPAMAADNNRHENRIDNRLDRLDSRLDNQRGFLLEDVSPSFVTNEGLADELCSPLSSDALNDAIPGCLFGGRNDDSDFVSG